MPAARVAIAALGIAVTVARHPAVRAGARAILDNPQARAAAEQAVRRAAYGAGVLARRIVPRSLIR